MCISCSQSVTISQRVLVILHNSTLTQFNGTSKMCPYNDSNLVRLRFAVENVLKSCSNRVTSSLLDSFGLRMQSGNTFLFNVNSELYTLFCFFLLSLKQYNVYFFGTFK